MKSTIKVKECDKCRDISNTYAGVARTSLKSKCSICNGKGYLQQDSSQLPKIGDEYVPDNNFFLQWDYAIRYKMDGKKLKLKDIKINTKKLEAVCEWK